MSQAEVVAALEKHGPMTKDEIAEHINAEPWTVVQSIARLRRKGKIEDIEIKDRKKGGALFKYRLK